MNYDKMMKVKNFCKRHPERFDPYCQGIEAKGKYSFLGLAAMFALGLNPLSDNPRSRLSESLLPTVERAREYLELDQFATALLWQYTKCCDLKIVDQVMNLYLFNQSIEIDGLRIEKKDLHFV